MGRPKRAPKKPTEVKYSESCGICIPGLVVCPESIDDDAWKDNDCNHVFEENFEMFLRKQKDKNTQTSTQFKMKHEQRMSFVSMTWLSNVNSEDGEKFNAHRLAMVGERFGADHNRRFPRWADDLLEGFGGADDLIAHLKDLANEPSLKKLLKRDSNGAYLDWDISSISAESCKAVKKDLVISARRWVVEQLDVALEEFKAFRGGLDEKEREKYDKLVEMQNEKWCDFECGDISFEEMDIAIREIQNEMDDIIARHNNQNKDIDSLVELIEGKQLGAIPKNKKEKIPKSKKKKNPDLKCKRTNQHIITQKSKEKIVKFKSETFSIDIEDFKSHEASSLVVEETKEALNITKAQPEETKNQLRKGKSNESSLSENAKIDDKLKESKKALNNARDQLEKTKNQLREEKMHEDSLFENTKMGDKLTETKKALNVTKAQLEETKNQLREEKLKTDHLNIKLTSSFQENDLLKSKLLHNDFKKYRDVLRQRQKNNFSVMDHLRASPELDHTPSVQQALSSLHEFSAHLLLAEEQLSAQYATLSQQVQTSKTIPELHFNMFNVEPPDLGSSYINLLYRSICQSSTLPVPPPLVSSQTSTSSPHRSSLPTSHALDRTQSSRVAGTISSSMPLIGSQGTGTGFPHSLVPTGSVVSFPSNVAAATCGHTAGAAHLNVKQKPAQIKKFASLKLPDKVTNKVVSYVERSGASSNTEDEGCSICFEEMLERNTFNLKVCRHRFHVTCLKRWLESPRGECSTCPMCRTDIVKEDKLIILEATRRRF